MSGDHRPGCVSFNIQSTFARWVVAGLPATSRGDQSSADVDQRSARPSALGSISDAAPLPATGQPGNPATITQQLSNPATQEPNTPTPRLHLETTFPILR